MSRVQSSESSRHEQPPAGVTVESQAKYDACVDLLKNMPRNLGSVAKNVEALEKEMGRDGTLTTADLDLIFAFATALANNANNPQVTAAIGDVLQAARSIVKRDGELSDSETSLVRQILRAASDGKTSTAKLVAVCEKFAQYERSDAGLTEVERDDIVALLNRPNSDFQPAPAPAPRPGGRPPTASPPGPRQPTGPGPAPTPGAAPTVPAVPAPAPGTQTQQGWNLSLAGSGVATTVRTPTPILSGENSNAAGVSIQQMARDGTEVNYKGLTFRAAEVPGGYKLQQKVGPNKWIGAGKTMNATATVKWGNTYEADLGVSGGSSGTVPYSSGKPQGGSGSGGVYAKYKPFWTITAQELKQTNRGGKPTWGNQTRVRAYPAVATVTAGGQGTAGEGGSANINGGTQGPTLEYRFGTIKPAQSNTAYPVQDMIEGGFSLTGIDGNFNANLALQGQVNGGAGPVKIAVGLWYLGINRNKQLMEKFGRRGNEASVDDLTLPLPPTGQPAAGAAPAGERRDRTARIADAFGSALQHYVISAQASARPMTYGGTVQWNAPAPPAPPAQKGTGGSAVADKSTEEAAPLAGRALLLKRTTAPAPAPAPAPAAPKPKPLDLSGNMPPGADAQDLIAQGQQQLRQASDELGALAGALGVMKLDKLLGPAKTMIDTAFAARDAVSGLRGRMPSGSSEAFAGKAGAKAMAAFGEAVVGRAIEKMLSDPEVIPTLSRKKGETDAQWASRIATQIPKYAAEAAQDVLADPKQFVGEVLGALIEEATSFVEDKIAQAKRNAELALEVGSAVNAAGREALDTTDSRRGREPPTQLPPLYLGGDTAADDTPAGQVLKQHYGVNKHGHIKPAELQQALDDGVVTKLPNGGLEIDTKALRAVTADEPLPPVFINGSPAPANSRALALFKDKYNVGANGRIDPLDLQMAVHAGIVTKGRNGELELNTDILNASFPREPLPTLSLNGEPVPSQDIPVFIAFNKQYGVDAQGTIDPVKWQQAIDDGVITRTPTGGFNVNSKALRAVMPDLPLPPMYVDGQPANKQPVALELFKQKYQVSDDGRINPVSLEMALFAGIVTKRPNGGLDINTAKLEADFSTTQLPPVFIDGKPADATSPDLEVFKRLYGVDENGTIDLARLQQAVKDGGVTQGAGGRLNLDVDALRALALQFWAGPGGITTADEFNSLREVYDLPALTDAQFATLAGLSSLNDAGQVEPRFVQGNSNLRLDSEDFFWESERYGANVYSSDNGPVGDSAAYQAYLVLCRDYGVPALASDQWTALIDEQLNSPSAVPVANFNWMTAYST